MQTNFILYVKNQNISTDFYQKVFTSEPTLNVPGMSEFKLGNGFILGLMPEKGIKRLLGDSIGDPEASNGISRCELYFTVAAPQMYLDRACQMGAKILSPLAKRDWGDEAGYVKDLDGHIVAFAKKSCI